MPRKQRFKPSRKPKLADGTQLLVLAADAKSEHSCYGAERHESSASSTPTDEAPPGFVFRHLRGRDAVIDD